MFYFQPKYCFLILFFLILGTLLGQMSHESLILLKMEGELKHYFQRSPNTNELVVDMLYICFSCQNNALKNQKVQYNLYVFLYMSLLEINKMSMNLLIVAVL